MLIAGGPLVAYSRPKCWKFTTVDLTPFFRIVAAIRTHCNTRCEYVSVGIANGQGCGAIRRVMFLLSMDAVMGHVPTYGSGIDNCFTPPEKHTTSQAIYLKGSGGLEIHYDAATGAPFDFDKKIDFDVVFREKYAQDSYTIYVGCGGCVWPLDPITGRMPAIRDEYQPRQVEPFTQTAYYSVFKEGENRKFDTNLLRSDHCTTSHFSVRLVDHHNRSNPDHEPLIWSAVIGKAEVFSPLQWISFPTYILRNHGDAWNQLGWTYPVVLPAVLLLFWLGRWLVEKGRGQDFKMSVFNPDMVLLPRAWCSELAIVAFLAAGVEEFIHLTYALAGAPINWFGGGVGYVVVIFLANGIPIWVQVWIWRKTILAKNNASRDEREMEGFAKPQYWPFQLGLGVAWLFLLGAGFYVGPALVIIDSLFRGVEWRTGWRSPYAPAVWNTMAVAKRVGWFAPLERQERVVRAPLVVNTEAPSVYKFRL